MGESFTTGQRNRIAQQGQGQGQSRSGAAATSSNKSSDDLGILKSISEMGEEVKKKLSALAVSFNSATSAGGASTAGGASAPQRRYSGYGRHDDTDEAESMLKSATYEVWYGIIRYRVWYGTVVV